MSVEANSVQAAINAPLPSPPLAIDSAVRGLTTHSQIDSADEQDINDSASARPEVTSLSNYSFGLTIAAE
jgi:hypothetical protein